jgi:hypothetical protein
MYMLNWMSLQVHYSDAMCHTARQYHSVAAAFTSQPVGVCTEHLLWLGFQAATPCARPCLTCSANNFVCKLHHCRTIQCCGCWVMAPGVLGPQCCARPCLHKNLLIGCCVRVLRLCCKSHNPPSQQPTCLVTICLYASCVVLQKLSGHNEQTINSSRAPAYAPAYRLACTHAIAVVLQVPQPPKPAAHLPCDNLFVRRLCPLTKAVRAP